MSELYSRITEECEKAMREKNETRRDTLRALLSAFHNREIEKRGKGSDEPLINDEVLEIIRKEVKKRREASELYKKGGREDLMEREESERAILEEFLPPAPTSGEINQAIDDAILKWGSDAKNFGKIMGDVINALKGGVEGGVISAEIKSRLAKKE